ncbi:MAG TPA: HAD family hydrolase [Candidatus Margulisiibacteriota bacterium]|nr:HAD family hydrolase [Candidatus Margulisiibacteriota bacterium]
MPRALLFDLFGTVVQFKPQVPAVEVAGTPWRTTMGWLRATAERELPDVSFDELLPALLQVTEDIVRRRAPEYREVPSRERFCRALLRVNVTAAQAPDIAERLSLAHMAHLASMTVLPPAHRLLLRELAGRYRLGLVSNFDHGPTARRVLLDHGVAEFFPTTLISAEFGRRKPHPAIFEAALHGVGVRAAEALFIGDSVADDVVGAHGAGVPVAWLNANNAPLTVGAPVPQHIITRLTDLLAVLQQP